MHSVPSTVSVQSQLSHVHEPVAVLMHSVVYSVKSVTFVLNIYVS